MTVTAISREPLFTVIAPDGSERGFGPDTLLIGMLLAACPGGRCVASEAGGCRDLNEFERAALRRGVRFGGADPDRYPCLSATGRTA